MRRKRDHGIIMHDYTNCQSWQVPCRVPVGDEAQFIFLICDQTKWAETILRFGVLDSFGKTHWCSRWDAKEVRRKFAEAFTRMVQNKNVDGTV